MDRLCEFCCWAGRRGFGASAATPKYGADAFMFRVLFEWRGFWAREGLGRGSSMKRVVDVEGFFSTTMSWEPVLILVLGWASRLCLGVLLAGVVGRAD